MKLGDLAYYAFRPLVYFVDLIWGTDLRHCDKCKARRKRWNAVRFSRLWGSLIFAVTIWGVIIWWRA